MLALAERNALDQGLGWAFCDTDSLAIANVAGLAESKFIARVEAVRAWFGLLNPYEAKGSILQLEKVNYPPGEHRDPAALRPVNCLAISAKRYVLFDRTADGSPVIRKASAHGLGHMLPPYPDPDRSRIGRIGVQLWQEDLWREIIRAYDVGRADQADLDRLPGLELPAPTRYAVTNRTLLNWFSGYNACVAEADRIWPFNFLLTFQTKSRMEMAATEPDGLRSPAWNRKTPKPASRYSSNIVKDRPEVFDRSTGAAIPWEWLRSYRRALAAHHLHSETKFRGGEDNERGTLVRRHVKVWRAIPIGKEADNLEEREFFGEGDESVEWGLVREDRKRLLADIEELLATHNISDRTVLEHAHVSRRTLTALREGGRVASQSLLNLARAAEELSRERSSRANSNEYWRLRALRLRDEVGGRNQLARLLGVSAPYLGRILRCEKPMTAEMVNRLAAVNLIETTGPRSVSEGIA